MKTTFDFELDNIDNSDKVLSILRLYGICIVRNYLINAKMEAVKKEYDTLLYGKNSDKNSINHPINKNGKIRRTTHGELKSESCTNIVDLFHNNLCESITDAYFPDGCIFNKDVFLTHEKPDNKPILPWHHDRIQALKFYINLLDVTQQDGALEYVPGSHRIGYYRANYYIATGCPIQDIPNDIPDDEILYAKVIAVSAGDLIIFDADGFHRGGVVADGHERKVIRAHTNPLPYLGYGKPKLFSKDWWIRSPLNFARLYKDSIGRVLGDEIKFRGTQGKYRS